jgi:2'-hydroxyisoflavone reductase
MHCSRRTALFTRRRFLKSAALTAATARILPRAYGSVAPQKILVLGGTLFLGPAIVERAVEAGHQVTLFNRGRTNPQLFPQLEKLRGDRESTAADGLSALAGGRRWDAVIDVWPSEPAVALPAARLLAGRTDFYSFVSSIGAYKTLTRPGADETWPLRSTESGYGGDKARCEAQLITLIGADRLGIVRPCAIAGPRDPSLSLHYWLSRLAKKERIVAPGDGSDPVELVDVRDVAGWIVSNVESRRPGAYNVCGEPQSFRTFLAQCSAAMEGKAQPVWIDGNFLERQGVKSAGNMPFWNPDIPAFEEVSSLKAHRAGWTVRPLQQTARDAWSSYSGRIDPNLSYPQHQWSYDWGISDELQTKILAAWDTRVPRRAG